VRRVAAAGTHLRTGDLLAGPAVGTVTGLRREARVEVDAHDIGVLAVTVA